MTKQIYYEDIGVGSELPTLIKHPTSRQLVKWAGVSGDYYEIHYDNDFAKSTGLPGIIVHGMLTASFLGQVVTDWMGEWGTLKKFSTSNRAMLFPGHDVTCKGVVSNKYNKDGEHFIECKTWTENDKGEKTTTAVAIVTVPSHKQPVNK
jgi:acyl dehydratase